MRVWPALLGLCLATAGTSCAFLLDFDELQSESGRDAGGASGGGSGGAGGTGGADAAPPALTELAKAFATSTCERLKKCRGPLFGFMFGEEECQPYLERIFGDGPLADIDQVPTARFSYHPELIGACLSAIEKAPCDVVVHWPKECDAALDGTGVAGSTCVHSLECPADQYCSCPGTCVAVPKLGEACASGICARGLYCERGNICRKPVTTENAPCEGGTEPRCALDMLCLGAKKGVPGQCRKNLGLFTADKDYPCNWTTGSLCVEGFFCELPTADAAADGKCVPPSQQLEACTLSLPDSCPHDFYCSGLPEGFCVSLPGAGSKCTAVALKGSCKQGARCVGRDENDPATTPGDCKALIPNGIGCEISEQCYSNLCAGTKCRSPYSCIGWK